MQWNEGLTGTALRIAEVDTPYLRVMAGPGTGKTFAMMRRVARLLQEGADPKRILAVTFTRTAAASLLKDLGSLKVEGCDSIWAGTLHSFCFSLLSKADVFDYSGRIPRPLVTFSKSGCLQFEAAPLLQDMDSKETFGTKRERTERIRAFDAAWARLQADTPGWPADGVDRQFQDSLLAWLQFHRAMLIGELVPEALKYLRANPESGYLRRFDHVVVDEYQDLNKAEQVLIDLLSSNAQCTVVGDEDQSIYRFRHAHPDGIVEFAAAHESTSDESLTECRRCPTTVVGLANQFIQCNHPADCTSSRLSPMSGNPQGEVHIVQWGTLDDEAAGLAGFVDHLTKNKGYQRGDILVLSPRRIIGYGIRDALVAKGIDTHSFYHEEALEEKDAQRAFSVLSLLVDIGDRVALRFLLGFGHASWLEDEYRVLREYCEKSGIPPYDALLLTQSGQLEMGGTVRLLRRFALLSLELQQLQGLTGHSLVERLFPRDNDWARPVRDITDLLVTDDTSPGELLEILRTRVTQPEMPESGDYVRVMSLHKSKGLTSKVVVIAGCIQGLIPFLDRDETPEERTETLREQRRLFYVAITRPREILVISSALRVNRKLGYRMGAQLSYGKSETASTMTSEFIPQLGPSAPAVARGSVWASKGYSI